MLIIALFKEDSKFDYFKINNRQKFIEIIKNVYFYFFIDIAMLKNIEITKKFYYRTQKQKI